MSSAKTPNLNENEKKVLIFLAGYYTDFGEERYTYFRVIAESTKLEIPVVRRACRSLMRKGYTSYMRGLFDDDGMVAGSGYTATAAGAARAEIEDMEFTTPEAREAALRGVITQPFDF